MSGEDLWAAAAAQEIEAEPVPASGLMLTKCRGCGGPDVLAVPHMVPVAVCEMCRWAGVKPAGEPIEREAVQGLCCFPMPLIEEARERSQHPAPGEVGHWGDGREDAPGPVVSLAEAARRAGWQCEVRYARGNGVHGSTGRPTSLRHSFAMRFGGHPLSRCEARAVYVRPAAGSGAWAWGSVWLWGPAVPFFGWASVAGLKVWLAAGGAVEPEWYAEVRGLAELAEALRREAVKRRAEDAPAKRKPKESGG